MGIFDSAKDLLKGHEAEAAAAVDKAGDMIDEKTGGKYAEQVDQGQAMIKEQLGVPTQPAAEAPAAEPAPIEEPAQPIEEPQA